MTIPRSTLLALCVAAVMTAPGAAHAATFVVTSTADAPDAQIDGVCATAAVPPVCTLRAAIQEANATPAADDVTVPAGKLTLKRVGAGEDAAATGDLDVAADLTVVGAGTKATVVNGKNDRVLQILPGVAVTLRDLTIAKGKSGKKDDAGDAVSGGGILNAGALTLERVVVSGNATGHEGGGIASLGGTLTLTDVTVTKNKALDNDSGGVHLVDAVATFLNVTISKNKSADEAGGVMVTADAALTMTNGTVSGNAAKDEGGGLRLEDGGTATLTNVTFVGNKTKTGAGGVDPGPTAGAVTLRNVILDRNKPVNCGGPVTLQGGNLESGASCGLPAGASNLKKVGLAGLKNNGGATATHALKKTSPAIDFGVDANCPAVDQRGQARVDVPGVGSAICDSGAFELVPAP